VADLSHDTDRAVAEGRALLSDNRGGGRHRKAGGRSIGRGSADLKRAHLLARLRNVAIGTALVIAAAVGTGLAIGGLGFAGLVATMFALLLVVAVLATFPRMKVPRRADLARAPDMQRLVGQTELWLEAQRPTLPPPAAHLIDRIGLQLDGLGQQLEGVEPNHPRAREIRALVGEQLPEIVDSYRKIPAHLRRESRAGGTPDQQLGEGLGRISQEIDSLTRDLAESSLDDLAVRARYLDYRYGEGDTPVKETD